MKASVKNKRYFQANAAYFIEDIKKADVATFSQFAHFNFYFLNKIKSFPS